MELSTASKLHSLECGDERCSGGEIAPQPTNKVKLKWLTNFNRAQ